MRKFKRRVKNFVTKLYLRLSGSSLVQTQTGGTGGGEADPAMSALLRRVAAEGAVLLKNDGTLPLTGKFALFGRVQTDTFFAGYGSGGDVRKPYAVSILEGLKGAGAPLVGALAHRYEEWSKAHPAEKGGWGDWPWSYPEMPLRDEEIAACAKETDTAVVIIGRAAGEDRDNELERGSFYLTREEERLLAQVKGAFAHVAVVLNIGNIMDFSFLDDPAVGAALIVWQGGMEAGNACADVLLGKVNPCGRLPDTVARAYSDHPSARHFGGARHNEYYEDIYVGYRYFSTFGVPVRFPFAHGLSYTAFSRRAEYTGGEVRVVVKNVGSRAGREAVTLFVRKPGAPVESPARELIGFAKTRCLASGGEETLTIPVADRDLCVYDDARSAWVLQGGTYELYAGGDVLSAQRIGGFTRRERVFEQCARRAAPRVGFCTLTQNGGTMSAVAPQSDVRAAMEESIPAPFSAGACPCTLGDVAAGKATMEEFVAQLSPAELEAISRGDYTMNSPLGASGNAGVFGGVLPSLREKGVPPVTATDGPSGIRLHAAASLLPIGTLLASTFDPALVEELYRAVGEEMKRLGSHVLLAPGMNIHRDPLCGRNFEYYSEDPCLTGRIAAAAVRGVQSAGASACPKHFACNNQEYNRNANDSRLSERALREIYLRGFEICVKEGKPHFLMTSYNKINGIWAHYHFELVRGILRGEWGFDGCVMTDWWMRSARCPQFPKLRVNAYRVRAGVNLLMPGGKYVGRHRPDGTLLATLGKRGGIALGELQRNAAEILRDVLKTYAMQPERPPEAKA